jgi:hypothetical protein
VEETDLHATPRLVVVADVMLVWLHGSTSDRRAGPFVMEPHHRGRALVWGHKVAPSFVVIAMS